MLDVQLEDSPVRIRPELHHLAVPIDTVAPWPNNPRRGDLPKLKTSLAEHGQYAALLVQDATGQVVKGNNTLAAMQEMGATHVAVLRLDLDDDRARRILAIDNRSTDDADYDQRLLAELLAELPELDGTGWEQEELDTLLRSTDLYGDQATSFLDDLTGEPPAAATPAPAHLTGEPALTETGTPEEPAAADAPAAAAAGGDGVVWVQLNWTATYEQREIIRQAIRTAQERLNLPTSVEALTAICEHYQQTAVTA